MGWESGRYGVFCDVCTDHDYAGRGVIPEGWVSHSLGYMLCPKCAEQKWTIRNVGGQVILPAGYEIGWVGVDTSPRSYDPVKAAGFGSKVIGRMGG